MKILISSDLHLHRRLRLEDAINNLRAIEDMSAKNSYDVYLITGDIFHTNRPTIEEVTVFANHLQRIHAKRILLCVGNHDRFSCDAHSLQWTSIDPRIKLKDEFDIELIGQRCLFTHKNIIESKFSTCNISLPGISVEDLKEYDVVISGHIHRPQILNKNPLVLIPGSLFKITFNERDDEKFFYSLTLNKNTAPKLIKHNLITRKMLQIKYFIDEKRININDENVTKLSVKDAIVQLEIIGKKESVRKLNYDKLIKTYADCYSLTDIKVTYTASDKVKIDSIERDDFTINTHTITEQLKRYCEFNNLSARIKKAALNIIISTQLEDY